MQGWQGIEMGTPVKPRMQESGGGSSLGVAEALPTPSARNNISNIKFESSGALSPAANTAVDGLRIQFNSGNIAEGGFYLYGLKTA